MPNKKFFLYDKLFHSHSLKTYKVAIISFLLIILIIIFFVNYKSLFKIVEGNNGCKFSNLKKMEKNIEAKAEKYKKDLPNQDDSKTKLGRIGDIKSKVDVNSI
jgi:hypothetical protein